MTYKELANRILQLSEKQQNMKVVRFDGMNNNGCYEGVFFRVGALSVIENEDEFNALEVGHPYLEA